MIAAHAHIVPSSVAAGNRLVTRVWPSLQETTAMIVTVVCQTLCGISGHAMVMHFESTRLSLQCMSCGHTTAGWTLPGRT